MARVVEISEEDLLRHRQLAEVAGAINKHPQGKLLLQQATKLVYPNAKTPDLDAAVTDYNRGTAIDQKLAEMDQRWANEKAERDLTEKRNKIIADYENGFNDLRKSGYTDAGITEIKKIMEEKGILDHSIAAAYFDKVHPPQNITTPHMGAWNFMGDAQDDDIELKKLMETASPRGLNEGVVDSLARNALSDVRGQPPMKR